MEPFSYLDQERDFTGRVGSELRSLKRLFPSRVSWRLPVRLQVTIQAFRKILIVALIRSRTIPR
jgi:hypothetical protein